MKTLLSILIGIGLIASPLARGKTISSSIYTPAPFLLDVDGGVIVGAGQALPGVSLQVAGNLKTDFPLYLGGELGLFVTTSGSPTSAVIPILAKVYTPVRLSQSSTLRLGASLGPVVATSGNYSGSGFAFLIDPALVFGMGGTTDLSAQARFGVMGGEFVVLPQLGLSFAI